MPQHTLWFFVHFHLDEADGGKELAPYERFLYTEADDSGSRKLMIRKKQESRRFRVKIFRLPAQNRGRPFAYIDET